MNIVLPFRYVFFGIFVICNAIICSAAAWNFGIAQMIGRRMEIDGYLIFLGAMDLAFVVVISVIELTRKNALTSRVWFECIWLGVLLILHISGAAVLSSAGSGVMCDPILVAQIPDACTSLRLTLAASWICAIILLFYFAILTISAYMRHKEDRTVWQATVRDYCWTSFCTKLPNSDALPAPPLKAASIKAPQPRRLALPAMYAQGADYDVERGYYERPIPPVPALPQRHMRQVTREAIQPLPPSLYPRHLQGYAPPTQPAPRPPASETPPPLGSWPRANIVNEPVTKKRRAPPSAPRAAPLPALQPNPPPVFVPAPTSRPAGPRTTPARTPKKPSGDWRSRVVVPPPLDLSKISSKRPSTR